MAKSDMKTKVTEVSVADFVAAVSDDGQRADAETMCAIMERLSGDPPKMWGPSIIGFGSYHYRYESGREGEMPRIGFSPRKGQAVVYLVDGFPHHAELLAKLGKYKTGKSCLYIKRLSDVDTHIFEKLCAASLASMDEKYPKG